MRHIRRLWDMRGERAGARRSGWVEVLRWGVVVSVVGGVMAGAMVAADDDEDEPEEDLVPAALKQWGRDFSAVKEWRGIWEVSVKGGAARATESGHMESRYEASSFGSFLLRRATSGEGGWEPKAGVLTWRGEGTAHGHGLGDFSEWEHLYGVGTDWQQSFRGSMEQAQIEFSLTFGNGARSVTLHPGIYDQERTPKMHRTGYALSLGSGQELVNHPIDERFAAPVDTWFLGVTEADAARRWNDVSGGPGVLIFFHESPTSGRNQKFEISGEGVTQRSRVYLFPVYDEFEVVVTIDGYAEWRPKGLIADPQKSGSALVVRAALQNKEGPPGKDLPEVKQFSFKLLDTSREPGIAMNWPLNANDRDYDLKLTQATTGGDASDEAQKFVVKKPPTDEAARPYAETTVESYDFGGRASLLVICELADGRELIGLLKEPGGQQDLVRIPKMTGPGWIAESWRKANDVMTLPENDDAEEVKGQEHKGDGFTLYEEYRGWVVNGKHREGNPKRKDFFVLNQRGPDFRGGIALFERLSQLRVHSTLREYKEIEANDRRMNKNHRDAPHRVDQHAVVLSRDNGGGGGFTAAEDGVDGKRALRPRYVKAIFLEYSEGGRGVGVFSLSGGTKYQLSLRDSELAWDRAVAHELLHAVGVDHHGESVREKLVAYFQGPTAPLNPTGRPRYVATPSLGPQNYRQDGSTHFPQTWSDDRGPELKLRWEDSRKDTFVEDMPEYERWMNNLRRPAGSEVPDYYVTASRQLANLGKTPEFWQRYDDEGTAAYQITKIIWVGAEGGTDSGDDLCVMKYYFANAYREKGQANSYYMIRPGAVRAGREICHHATGTGGNAASHQPQSRFGNAAAGRGNCFGQICPNDAIPPRRVMAN